LRKARNSSRTPLPDLNRTHDLSLERSENPRVGGSSPSPGTICFKGLRGVPIGRECQAGAARRLEEGTGMTSARLLLVMLMVTLLPVLSLVEAPLPQASAAPQVIKIGVVDFYAPTPLAAFSGVFPERFAADELSNLLVRSPSDRFKVIPRATMQQAEGAMRWQEADVLHFDRLRALANSVTADLLVVGWIPLLQVETGGGGGSPPLASDGGGLPSALVNLVVQVFDGAQARVVGETHQSAEFILGNNSSLLTTHVLQIALQRALPDVLRMLTAQAP
jgi:hypothetical protein